MTTDAREEEGSIASNLARVQRQIEAACQRSGRAPEEVRLVAVSKAHPAEAISAALEAGHRDFGESYVQEWQEKAGALAREPVRWHIIGALQSNKIKHLMDGPGPLPALIHSVDRTSLLKEIEKRAPGEIDVLLQVNVSGEASKSGVAPEGLRALLEDALGREHVRPVGLMTIPPYDPDPETARPHFQALRRLRDELSAEPGLEDLRELSMGMSGDFEVAIEEGATLVRVGTAIFGERDG